MEQYLVVRFEIRKNNVGHIWPHNSNIGGELTWGLKILGA